MAASRTAQAASLVQDGRLSKTAVMILATAASVFLERGYEVSLGEIALAAGITTPTIYAYFGSKRALFRAAMIRVAEEIPPAIAPPSLDLDLRQELLRYAWASRRVILLERNLAVLRIVAIAVRDDPELGRLMVAKTTFAISAALAGFFAQAMEAGAVRRMDPAVLAEVFFSAAAGQSRTRQLLCVEPDPADRAAAYLEQFVDCFLDGVAAPVTER